MDIFGLVIVGIDFIICQVMAKVTTGKITQLKFDDHNANLGTEQGQELIDQSIANLGLGRSVVVDKNNKLIAGNKTTTGAIENGVEKVIFVDTTGDELVVVRRNDMDLDDIDDPRARALALADNRTGAVNLAWNPVEMQIHFDAVANLGMEAFVFDLSMDLNTKEKKHSDLSGNLDKMFKIELEFDDEHSQQEAYETLQNMGYSCRILTL